MFRFLFSVSALLSLSFLATTPAQAQERKGTQDYICVQAQQDVTVFTYGATATSDPDVNKEIYEEGRFFYIKAAPRMGYPNGDATYFLKEKPASFVDNKHIRLVRQAECE